ncbi:hypothetical protein TNCV_1770281 [Trichonephila clavipes]|nr:hypothetical protein TNCV_1770281 [Trichonephila clavipes]
MPNSPSKSSQICSVGDKSWDRANLGRVVTVWRLSCHVRPSIVLLKNVSWESIHEWQHMKLQDDMDIPLGCHVVSRINTRGDHAL